MQENNSRTYKVRVDDWSNARFLHTQDNLVMFEVMWLRCGCHSCFSRLNTVMNRMQAAEVREWHVSTMPVPERGFLAEPSVVLYLEPKEMPRDVVAFVSEILGLPVREVFDAPGATSTN